MLNLHAQAYVEAVAETYGGFFRVLYKPGGEEGLGYTYEATLTLVGDNNLNVSVEGKNMPEVMEKLYEKAKAWHDTRSIPDKFMTCLVSRDKEYGITH